MPLKAKHLLGFSFVILVLLLGVVFYRLHTSTKPPTSHVLIETSSALTLPTLIYGDIALQNIQSFEINSNQLKATPKHYQAFTEGFLPRPEHASILSLVRDLAPDVPESFHEYAQFDQQYVVAFSGDLSQVFVVDVALGTASPLKFLPMENLGKMYVSHITKLDNHLILLAYAANTYDAFVYVIDWSTLDVVQATRLPSLSAARYEKDYTLTANGLAYFVTEEGLLIYDVQNEHTQTMALPYTIDRLLSSGDTVWAIEEESSTLLFHNLNATLSTTYQLPSETYSIIDLRVVDQYLYVLLHDPAGKRFSNYLSVYTLDTGEWLYCLGLSSLEPFALLGLDF